MNTVTSEQTTLKQLARKMRLVASYGAKLAHDKQSEWQRSATGWACTLRYQGRQYTFDFWQGQAITGEPDAQGVLECLLSDASVGEEDLEGFCGELGYDVDSRKAEQTWKACQRVSKAMKRLLGTDYEAFLYAERD